MRISTILLILLVMGQVLGCSGTGSSSAAEDFTTDDLLIAAGDGDLELVRRILDAGVNVNSAGEDGVTALMQSVSGANVDLVKYLLEAGAQPDAKDNEGMTAFLWAVDQCGGNAANDEELGPDYWEVMRILAKAGADVNARNNNGDSALTIAKSFEDETALAVLIQLGAE